MSRLIDAMWKDIYIEIQSDPFKEQTDKDFCKEYAVSPGTLANWKRENRVLIFDEVSERRKKFLAEMRSKADKALVKKFEKDTNALRLFYQLAGDLVERSEDYKDFMTRQERERRLDDLLKNIKSKKENFAKAESSGVKEPGDKQVVPLEPRPGENLPPTGA